MMDTAAPNYFLLIRLLAGSELSRQQVYSRFCALARLSETLRVPRLGPILLVFALTLPVCAQEFIPEQVVFPIADFKPYVYNLLPFNIKFGTGFCLDRDCRFVGTNYHVAKIMGKYVRIKGEFSAHRYLDSDPQEEGAQEIRIAGGASLKYTPAHDLAIYEMRHPLKHFHGIGFDADELESSAEVDIYAYPFNGNPKRGLVRWHGKFIGQTPEGLLAFSYAEGQVRGGASGGIVVDSKTTKIVGILSGIAESKNRIALAVPVKELADFVTRAQPYLQAALFPKTVFVSPLAADVYAPYVWPRVEGLLQRPAEPAAVVKLRRTAQNLADSMRNFTATQTFAWGHGNREPEVAEAYETLIVDGWQRWRRVGDKKLYDIVPFPPLNASIIPGPQWVELPGMVGTELNLRIHQAPDVIMDGRNVHVFQYGASVEDGVCGFRSTIYYGFFWRSTEKSYACHGEVWMDESGIILRISQALELSGPWYNLWEVVTYGWLEKDATRYLVPVTITMQAEHKNTYWCRGLFTDYEMFGVKSRVVPLEPERAQRSALNRQ
jgi:hypothetical protein